MVNQVGGRVKTIIYGVVTLLIFLLLLPISIGAVTAILAYTNLATFVGVEEVVGMVPILMLLEGIGASGFIMYQGIANRGASTDVMRIVWGVVVNFIFLTFFPVMLGGLYTIYDAMNGDVGPPIVDPMTGYQIIPVFGIFILVSAIGAGGALSFEGATGRRIWKRRGGSSHHKRGRN